MPHTYFTDTEEFFKGNTLLFILANIGTGQLKVNRRPVTRHPLKKSENACLPTAVIDNTRVNSNTPITTLTLHMWLNKNIVLLRK